jgi:hypothetical protein
MYLSEHTGRYSLPRNRYIPNFIINTKTGERIFGEEYLKPRYNKKNKKDKPKQI